MIEENKKRLIIIVLPITRELTSWYDKSEALFENRYDFIIYTLENLIDSNQVDVVIRMHPHAKDYGEWEIVHGICQRYNALRNNKYIISENLYEIEEVLNKGQYNPENIYFITTDGSIAIELGQLSLPIICTQKTFAPDLAYHKPETIEDYKNIILGKVNISFTNSRGLQKLCMLYANLYMNSILKGDNCLYGNHLKETLAKYYHFGLIERKWDPEEFADLIYQASELHNPRVLNAGKQFLKIYS